MIIHKVEGRRCTRRRVPSSYEKEIPEFNYNLNKHFSHFLFLEREN
ncbi:hypothetical protein P4S95_25680 [Aneurinibacillus aneurinilyticus]|nr:hypothetical protein [Aneurinibacillus aneurinilyticus]